MLPCTYQQDGRHRCPVETEHVHSQEQHGLQGEQGRGGEGRGGRGRDKVDYYMVKGRSGVHARLLSRAASPPPPHCTGSVHSPMRLSCSCHTEQ